MLMIKIKKLLLSLLLFELLFAYVPAFADAPSADYSTAGVSTQIETYLCSPKNGGSGVLYQCINQIYKFAIVLAAVIGVFFIVIAGYVYMSADGNSESVDKAKSILESTITSLVILLAGYVLLNSINPDLVQFHGNTLQPVTINVTPTGGGTTGGGTGTGTTGGGTGTTGGGTTVTTACNQSFGGSTSAGCTGSGCVDVSSYTSSHDCSSNGGICLLSPQAAQKAQSLINNFNQAGTNCALKISAAIEGSSGPSISSCHKNGTCADFNLIPYNSTCAQAFYNAVQASGAVSLLDEYVQACVASSTTGGNIHVNF
jgi:hypothetical protein